MSMMCRTTTSYNNPVSVLPRNEKKKPSEVVCTKIQGFATYINAQLQSEFLCQFQRRLVGFCCIDGCLKCDARQSEVLIAEYHKSRENIGNKSIGTKDKSGDSKENRKIHEYLSFIIWNDKWSISLPLPHNGAHRWIDAKWLTIAICRLSGEKTELLLHIAHIDRHSCSRLHRCSHLPSQYNWISFPNNTYYADKSFSDCLSIAECDVVSDFNQPSPPFIFRHLLFIHS